VAPASGAGGPSTSVRARYHSLLRIGIHTSSSGALVKAAQKAADLGANCFQIFSSSPRMWKSAPPPEESVKEMRAVRERHDLTPLAIHDSYLINLASENEVIRGKSIMAFRGELERAIAIGAEYLVMHPGSAKDQSLDSALATLAASLEEASKGLKPRCLTLLLENTAGGGSSIGRTLEELKNIRDLSMPRVPYPIAYCLDTCHLYASGFDVATSKGLDQTVKQAQTVLGLDLIPVIHSNDSKGALGSRLDRHANIGEGQIGREGFRRILNHPKLKAKAFILETPVDNEGDDQRNIDALKSLCRKSRG
jgi:deoxyribonuclease IV